jgi:hypothetical protein
MPLIAHAGVIDEKVKCTNSNHYEVVIYSRFESRVGVPESNETEYTAIVTAPNGAVSEYNKLASTSRIAGQEILTGPGFSLTIRTNGRRDPDGRQSSELRASFGRGEELTVAMSCE